MLLALISPTPIFHFLSSGTLLMLIQDHSEQEWHYLSSRLSCCLLVTWLHKRYSFFSTCKCLPSAGLFFQQIFRAGAGGSLQSRVTCLQLG